MSGPGPRWVLVAMPEDPAVAAWTQAADTTGVARPRIVPWTEVLDGGARFAEGELVHAERLTPAVQLRYGGSRERYESFAKALGLLDERIAEAGAVATADSSALLLALDRQRCAEHLGAAGVPVPQAGGVVVRQRFAEPGDAVSLVGTLIRTPLALMRGRSAFELRHGSVPRSYDGRDRESNDEGVSAEKVRTLLERDDETYRVKDLPAAYLDDVQYRFRFAVLDGRVTHAAGRPEDDRPAREYFGGRRREIDAYRKRFGDDAWLDLVGIAEQAAAAFPGLRSVGVDLAPDQTRRSDVTHAAPDPEATARVREAIAEKLAMIGLTLPPMPPTDSPAERLIAHDVVYDIDPFGARLPGASGWEGTVGEGLEVPAAMLRMWAARPAG